MLFLEAVGRAQHPAKRKAADVDASAGMVTITRRQFLTLKESDMKKLIVTAVVAAVLSLALGCAPKSRYHDTDMPDPKQFNAHFGDMDSKKDGFVSWEEFKAYFPKAEPKVFAAIDLNKDGALDHDEWHQFKEAHGLRHQ